MKQMRIVLAICAALMLMITIPAASAITVDGVIGDNEWNDNWAFGQTNNATAASEYNISELGDRLEVRQGGFGQDTTIWNAEDPKADGGTVDDGFNSDIAQRGDSSGSDLLRVYGHYNATEDTFYGLATVYGIPGDSDGDGNLDENCSNLHDCNGTAGPASAHPGQIGMGPDEVWRIRISQSGSSTAEIEIRNNNWTETEGVLDYNDIDTRFNPIEGGVYEIAVRNASKTWNIGPYEEPIKIEVQGSVEGDSAGEDTATAFVRFPSPNIDIEKSTNGVDADNPAGPYIATGEEVIWSYNVSNTGDVPLLDVVITDNRTGFTYQCDILPVGGWCNVTNTSVAIEGQYANLGNVTGHFGPFEVNDSDPSHYFGVNSSIDIEKATNGVDADDPTGPYVTVGGDVVWTYNVTNTGNSNLTDIVVQDNVPGVTPEYVSGDTNDDDTLEPNEVWMYNATDTAEEGQYANIGNVTGTDPTDAEVTDEDPSHYFGVNSSIDIEKATNGVDADDPTGPYVTVGGDVVWTYNVTNTGNSNLTDIVVQDNVPGVTPEYVS
ncbi:DUF11 domain-containing protein, partial [Methanohalophilus portucalensis]